MKGRYYVLDEHGYAVPSDMEAFASRFGDTDYRRIAETWYGDIWISTVFLGMDHSFSEDHPPILFETMVFGFYSGSAYDERLNSIEPSPGNPMWRYETRVDAEIGHEHAVDVVRRFRKGRYPVDPRHQQCPPVYLKKSEEEEEDVLS